MWARQQSGPTRDDVWATGEDHYMEPYRQMSRTTRARELTIMMMFLQTERNVNEPFEPLDLWQAGATAGA